jgi:hypothetical protein
VITAAAICPPAPLLAVELTGRDPVLPELRHAAATAVRRLTAYGPDVIVVVGPADRTAAWPILGRLDLTAYAPLLALRDQDRVSVSGPSLPSALGLGVRLLDEAGYGGQRLLQSVSSGEQPTVCQQLGAALADRKERTGLLVMADGSACRSPRAPGYLDTRAAGFDAAIEDAVRSGDLTALNALDQHLARELLATAHTAWQVLAAAMPSSGPGHILYADAPLGVYYLIAWLADTAPANWQNR